MFFREMFINRILRILNVIRILFRSKYNLALMINWQQIKIQYAENGNLECIPFAFDQFTLNITFIHYK